MTDFDDIDGVHKSQTHADEDNILHMSLIFFMLWVSFYGVSATALNHLIKLLQYITDLFTNIRFLVLKDIANGVLGKYHTNRKSIEIQLMQTFLNDMHVRSLADSDTALVHQDAFENLLNSKVDRAFNETVFGQHEYLSG